MDNTNKTNKISIAYAIFATKYGKGYGCFAISLTKNNIYCVSSSFCSPFDNLKFSKILARKKALSKIVGESDDVCYLTNDSKDIKNIITEYLSSDKKIPSWARHSVKHGAWVHTLKLDNLKYKKFVAEVLGSEKDGAYNVVDFLL